MKEIYYDYGSQMLRYPRLKSYFITKNSDFYIVPYSMKFNLI